MDALAVVASPIPSSPEAATGAPDAVVRHGKPERRPPRLHPVGWNGERRRPRTPVQPRPLDEPQAHVTFERLDKVAASPYCPRCGSLLFRQVEPGVLCSLCGRLWVVRELLVRAGIEAPRAPGDDGSIR